MVFCSVYGSQCFYMAEKAETFYPSVLLFILFRCSELKEMVNLGT